MTNMALPLKRITLGWRDTMWSRNNLLRIITTWWTMSWTSPLLLEWGEGCISIDRYMARRVTNPGIGPDGYHYRSDGLVKERSSATGLCCSDVELFSKAITTLKLSRLCVGDGQNNTSNSS